MVKLARSHLRQAEARVRAASTAFKGGNYPFTLRLSQEGVELALKASLRLVGVEYPKKHDVSGVLMDVRDRFPEWFRSQVPFLADTSKSLSKKREVSFYGSEEEFLSPEDFVKEEDAEDALSRARKTLELCVKLLGQYKE